MQTRKSDLVGNIQKILSREKTLKNKDLVGLVKSLNSRIRYLCVLFILSLGAGNGTHKASADAKR